MVKPPARPLIRCVPLLLAAAAFGAGSVALPGVALATARAVVLPGPVVPGVLGLPVLPSVVEDGVLPSVVEDAATLPLSEFPQVRVPLPVAGWVLGQPFDPGDGSDDQEEPADPDEAPDEPAPPSEPAVPAVPVVPALPAPAVPAVPTTAPAPRPTSGPRATWSPRPAPSSHRPTPADTRGLDDLFPDHTPSEGAVPGSDEQGDRANTAGAGGYAGPLIWSGIAGMLVSAIGIGVVLNRRRGW